MSRMNKGFSAPTSIEPTKQGSKIGLAIVTLSFWFVMTLLAMSLTWWKEITVEYGISKLPEIFKFMILDNGSENTAFILIAPLIATSIYLYYRYK